MTRAWPPSPTAPSTSVLRTRRPPGPSPHEIGGPGAISADRHETADLAATRTGAGLRWSRRALVRAVAAGTASAGAGVALTAVSGWLIVRAAEMPPVLTLLVAIVGVRAFGLGRAGLRWVERMTAHDAALRLAADLRVQVWGPWRPRARPPTGRRGRRWPAWSATSAWCRTFSVRVVPPALVAGTVTAATLGALALVSPAAAGAAAAVLLVTVALVLAAHRRVDAGAARAEAALRVAALRDTTTVLEGAADLRAHGLAGPDGGGPGGARRGPDGGRPRTHPGRRAGHRGGRPRHRLAAVAAASAGAASGLSARRSRCSRSPRWRWPSRWPGW
jgi:ATP-binding cassette subfamily C protein CydCD